MKLFYDMMIPYIPDVMVFDDGTVVPDPKKAACRNAMVELSKFQNTGELICLYRAVDYACTYADTNIVDVILGLSDKLEIPDVSLEHLIDIAARLLFISIKPEAKFDINMFASYVLSAAHSGLVYINEQNMRQENVTEKSDNQISLDDIMKTSS